jgi:hypothetical protein
MTALVAPLEAGPMAPAGEPTRGGRPLTCERCASPKIQWLTPPDRAHCGALLFCDECRHLTILTRRTILAAASLLRAA